MRLHKKQRARHEDIRYYYEYMTNLQKKLALPMLSTNHGGFVNQGRDTSDYEKFSDITLRIQFDNIGSFPMSIDIHTHRVILADKSLYFERLFSGDFNNNNNESTSSSSVIPIRLTLPYSEAPVVREFFRLFKMSIFEDCHFRETSRYEFIVTNVLLLHQMAEQFLFHSLRKYCRHKIYERFEISLFGTIYEQCVSHGPNSNTLFVIPGRESLFKRLISWYVCCADTRGTSHLPFMELCINEGESDDDHATSNIVNQITHQPNSIIIESQQQQQQQHQQQNQDNRKRKRFSGANDKKIETLNYMRGTIDNFDHYDSYSFFIKYETESRTTHIRAFGRICETCVHDKDTYHIARINQVIPAGTDKARRKWHFYLDMNNKNEPCSFYVRIDNNTANGLPSSPSPPLMRIESKITILSKLYKNKPQVAIPICSTLESFTNLQQFCINEPEFCYDGECDVCHLSRARIFIVKYEIDALFL